MTDAITQGDYGIEIRTEANNPFGFLHQISRRIVCDKWLNDRGILRATVLHKVPDNSDVLFWSLNANALDKIINQIDTIQVREPVENITYTMTADAFMIRAREFTLHGERQYAVQLREWETRDERGLLIECEYTREPKKGEPNRYTVSVKRTHVVEMPSEAPEMPETTDETAPYVEQAPESPKSSADAEIEPKVISLQEYFQRVHNGNDSVNLAEVGMTDDEIRALPHPDDREKAKPNPLELLRTTGKAYVEEHEPQAEIPKAVSEFDAKMSDMSAAYKKLLELPQDNKYVEALTSTCLRDMEQYVLRIAKEEPATIVGVILRKYPVL